jgi:RNA polymerase sigma-70 factor (ECF subfamily)
MTSIDWTSLATRAASASPSLLGLDVAGLARHLAQLGMTEPPAHLDDVVLAFAAVGGDTTAQTEVHHRVTRAARATLPTAGYADHIVDDTIGELALTLLTDARSPLLTYRGQASLSAWLRTLAARTALRLANISRRETAVATPDDELIDRVAATDLTRDLWRAELRDAVRRAFGSAITRVSYFERELLAAFIVRGQGLDEIANAHEVHRATAARWMARARAALDRELRSELERDLGASDSEVASILDSVRSSIELSVERLLAG